MKSSKKILSLIMAVVVMLTGIVNGMAVVSATGGATYRTLLNETFDGGDTTGFKDWTRNENHSTITANASDGEYVTIAAPGTSWAYCGFELSEPITTGEYEISFDFKGFSTDSRQGIYLKGKDGSKLSDTNDPRFLSADLRTEGALYAFGNKLTYTYDTTKWHTYNLKMTSVEGGYNTTVTVTSKDGTKKYSKSATIDTSNATTNEFTRIVFGYGHSVDIDNLVVKKAITPPEVESVEYYNAAGEKQDVLCETTKKIDVKFNEEVNEDMLDGIDFAADGESLVESGALSADKMTYTLTLSKLPTPGTDYTLTVPVAEYSVTITAESIVTPPEVEPDGMLLNKTFESAEDLSDFETWNGSGTAEITRNADNSATISTTGGFKNSGFILNGEVTTGEYEISFDFKGLNSSAATNGVYLARKSVNGAAYDKDFRLLAANGINLSALKELVISDYDTEEWYTYNLTMISKDGGYDVTANVGKVGSTPVKVEKSITTSEPFNKLVFMQAKGEEITIKNIVVKKKIIVPSVTGVEYYNAVNEKQDVLCQGTNKIKVKFSEAMNEDTLGNIDFTADGESLVIGREVSADKTIYTLTLSNMLTPDTVDYTLIVPDDVKSAEEINISDAYIITSKALAGNVLLAVDYDINKKDLKKYAGNYSAMEIRETDDNSSMYIKTSTGGQGYDLTKAIPDNGGDYRVQFDFKGLKRGNNGFVLGLSPSTENGQTQFGLLGMTSAGKVAVASFTSALAPDATKWYSYDLIFNRTTGAYDLTIIDKEAKTIAATQKGTFTRKGKDEQGGKNNCGANMISDFTYDTFKFFLSAEVEIDNIVVSEVIKAPVLDNSSVAFVKADEVIATAADNKLISLTTDKIALDFGTEMNAASVTKDSVKLEKVSTPVNIAVDYNVALNGTKVDITGFTFEEGTKYVVTVTTDVRSALNAPMAEEFTTEFTTKVRCADASIKELTGVDELSKLNGELTIKLDAENTTDTTANYVLLVAYYADRVLSHLEIVPVEIPADTDGEIIKTFTATKPDDATTAKVMLWESLSSVRPLCNLLSY